MGCREKPYSNFEIYRAMNQKVIVITGMHRSGTSLVANYLEKCNLNIGKELLNPNSSKATSESFAGHHEDMEFLDFHIDILRRNRKNSSGLLIQNARSLSRNVWKVPLEMNASDHRRAERLIESRSHIDQWGWKDPRTTLFLDFWEKTLEDAYYILLFRKPLAVVESLIRRGFNEKLAKNKLNFLKSWSIYNLEIIKFKEKVGNRAFICDIDEVIQQPEAFLESIKTDFKLDLTPIDFSLLFSPKSFHASPSPQILEIKRNYPDEIQQAEAIYQDLKRLSSLAYVAV